VSLLGMPQHRFESIHVVGTNGKSSVAAMTSAIVEAHGRRTGTYLSPHLDRWSERVLVCGREIDHAELASALARVAESVKVVNRTLDEGDSVTQFEAFTAAAFVAMAAAGVELGVIEAGLGGRLDATNVLPSRVTALTSVGLEHTQWLGETEEEIAGEKLAVLRDHSAIEVGRVSAPVASLARRVARERSVKPVFVKDLAPGINTRQEQAPVGVREGMEEQAPVGVREGMAPYQRRNFAVALAAAEAVIGSLDRDRVGVVASSLELPGRMQVLDRDPLLVVDAAHNPEGADALAEALGEMSGDRPAVACIAVLADKDAAGIVGALAERVELAICTELPAKRLADTGRPGARSLSAEALGELASAAGVGEVEVVGDPLAAIRRARDEAARRSGVAVVTGSHYLLGYARGVNE
jgi:dihydrofolate synthase/folylpolyglutamate synthase